SRRHGREPPHNGRREDMVSMTPGSQARIAARDRWLVSYADFTTLLFAVFATMYAISSVDAHKLAKLAQGLQVAFDDSSRQPSVASRAGVFAGHGSPVAAPGEVIGDIRPFVERELAPEIAIHRIEVSADRRGVILSIPEAGLFAI